VDKVLELKFGDLIFRINFGVETAAKRTQATIDDYILQQQTMGVTDEEILNNLNDDLKTDRLGLFKGFKNEVRDTVIGGLNQASSLGQFAEMSKQGMNSQYRWVAVGDKSSCDDCLQRHNRIETLEVWEAIGLPASGFSVCNERCRCILEPEVIPKHEKIILEK